ncbi:hypothetical protein VTK73DRAFT_3946 [Phialemonium thermophilum]|uniref:Ureidoglycolate hydrolase n=1 Tax=Phialemonium thermophilum TaxID=223376 RepID=A0ABR3Y0N9_9PEZI
MAPVLESTDARNKLDDLSGVQIQPGENPYDALINACKDDPVEIQSLYSTHRVTRNAQQKEKFLSPDFKELIIDPFLLRLEDKDVEPCFRDPRNCLVFWARPPDHIVKLAVHIQALLKRAASGLWLMPAQRMHLTTLEIAHSRTPEDIEDLLRQLRPSIAKITNYTYSHRARLVKPMVSFDLAAVAVSFLPAAGEPALVAADTVDAGAPGIVEGDGYTYHHLRRDIFESVRGTGVEIASRYVVPSAHITLGRYLRQTDHLTPEMRRQWIETIEGINKWLQDEVWDREDGEFSGEWIVGQERGLDARSGRLWYGGGRTIMVGEGF